LLRVFISLSYFAQTYYAMMTITKYRSGSEVGVKKPVTSKEWNTTSCYWCRWWFRPPPSLYEWKLDTWLQM